MHNFKKDLDVFISRLNTIKGYIQNEESTKTSLIMPFISLLGYDVFNPTELLPEYVADVGIKKGEKVDYAIVQNGNPIMLIEAKCVGEDLSKHYSQLYRYFSTTSSKFAILTDGVVYKFYSDIEEVNRLDSEPFIVIDLLNISDNDKNVLEAFRKSNFNINELSNDIVKWKYELKIKNSLELLFNSPSDDFIKMLSGSEDVVKFRPIVENLLKGCTFNATKVNSTNGGLTDGDSKTCTVNLSEFNYRVLSDKFDKITPISLYANGDELPLNSWKSIVVVEITYLYTKYKSKMRNYIDTPFKSKKVLFYSSMRLLEENYTIGAKENRVHKVDDGTYLYINYSPSAAIEFVMDVVDSLGVDKDYFAIKYTVM